MTQAHSLAETLAARRDKAKLLAAMSDAEAAALAHDWRFWARPAQLAPAGDWRVWLIMAGRGFGKTRTGAEWVREQISAGRNRGALVGPTAADVRDVMIEGESGILAISPQHERPTYEPSKRRLTWPNGAICTAYSADEPNRLRGPQHEFAWADELAAWNYPDAWDQILLGLRLGSDPRVCVTTTPRPRQLIRDLVASPLTHVTRGSTYDNALHLAPSFLSAILDKYEGTTLGQQEIHAHLLDEAPGALWNRSLIDTHRVAAPPPLRRIIVAIDPAITSRADSDETGIVAAGIDEHGHAYILADASGRYTPDGWAKRALAQLDALGGDRIIAEKNQGGDMVETVIRQQAERAPVKLVHASRGKIARAEPIAALYEQGRVHHVGAFSLLEDQLCNYAPGVDWSPDRLDALVWALTDLCIDGGRIAAAPSPYADTARADPIVRVQRRADRIRAQRPKLYD